MMLVTYSTAAACCIGTISLRTSQNAPKLLDSAPVHPTPWTDKYGAKTMLCRCSACVLTVTDDDDEDAAANDEQALILLR